MKATSVRRAGAAFAVALLLITAGCSSLGGSGGDATATPGTEPTEAATTEPTSTETPSSDGGNTPSQTTDERSPSDDETASNGETTSDDGTAATTGKMAVVIDGQRLVLSSATEGSERFRVDDEEPDTWHANGSLTLASALSEAQVDANASSLTYGDTYREQRQGTEIVYRVNGEPVDPSEYTLQDGDEVWVLVLTEETDVSTPGNYIPRDRLHVHGTMEFVVNGESLDFSREKWQTPSHNSYFHFEGGHAQPWHAHSWSVTLGYALSTLDGINASERGITYDGTTYAYDGTDATVSVEVNGEEVDPTTYYLKDGDSVRIVIQSDS